MKERVVAEVTRLGRTFNVRLLYGEEEKTIRYASGKARDFAAQLLKVARGYAITSNMLIYDFKRKENVKFSACALDFITGFEGGKDMNAGEVFNFISLIGGVLSKRNLRGELIVRIPDIDYEKVFELGESWYAEANATKYFY